MMGSTPLWASFVFLLAWVSAQPIVDLGYATYQGEDLANGVSQWLGLRYAAPPLGNLRFAAPQDPPTVDGVQDASAHGPTCISVGEYPISSGQSEDCLFLDVYAPSAGPSGDYKGRKLPVYFFIQGGGFASNANANYNGSGLIEASDMNIVVVTFNYRVGPYGFLASPQVEQQASLNNGIKDMIQALKWVQHHINEFGGDPNHVTVGGDSAGAGAVTLLLSAYDGSLEGLFHATAAESQSFATMLTAEESEYNYNNLTIRTGCDTAANTLACLRGLSTDALQEQNIAIAFPQGTLPPLYAWAPTIDGTLITDLTYRLFEQGRFLRLPTIFGDDTNEGTIFVPQNIDSVSAANTFIVDQFPYVSSDQLSWFDNTYLSEPDSQSYPNAAAYWEVTSTGYGEMRYICPGIALSALYTQYGVQNTWNYHYAVLDDEAIADGYGTSHTIELNAIWGPDYTNGGAPASYYNTNAAIVPVMQGYWTSFVRAFDPNTYRYPGSPEWDTWSQDLSSEYNRIFIRTNQTHMETVPQDQRERCAHLTSIGIDLRQ